MNAVKSCLIFYTLLSITTALVQVNMKDVGTPANKFIKFFNGKIFQRANFKNFALDNTLKVQESYFQQRLDHFNGEDGRTWKQRYFVNSEFYQTNGPVFLVIQGEGAADGESLQNSNVLAVESAKNMKAIIFSLEHRYYGKSQPTADLSVENLQYLSSRQALKDLEAFTIEMTRVYNLKDKSWYAFGGSYAGSLAAWYRLKSPEHVFASVASSAPLKSISNFKDYFGVVIKSIVAKHSQECADEINSATKDIQKLLAGNEEFRTYLTDAFGFCTPFEKDVKGSAETIFNTLASNFALIAQYNEDHFGEGDSGIANLNIPNLCKIMVNDTEGFTSIDKYAQVNQLIKEKVFQAPCTPISYKAMIDYLKDESWAGEAAEFSQRQWMYQTCSEFGFFQTSSWGVKDIFGHFPEDYYLQQCFDIFGEQFTRKFIHKAIKATNDFYGGKKGLLNTSNIILANGSLDPWHVLGVISRSDTNANNVVAYIHGTSHCADVYSPTSQDSLALTNGRAKIEAKLNSLSMPSEIPSQVV